MEAYFALLPSSQEQQSINWSPNSILVLPAKSGARPAQNHPRKFSFQPFFACTFHQLPKILHTHSLPLEWEANWYQPSLNQYTRSQSYRNPSCSCNYINGGTRNFLSFRTQWDKEQFGYIYTEAQMEKMGEIVCSSTLVIDLWNLVSLTHLVQKVLFTL